MMDSKYRVTASHAQLTEDSVYTARLQLLGAITTIDDVFDVDGYAKQHPELVAAFMQTAATNLHAAFLAREMYCSSNDACASVDKLIDQQ